MSKRTELTAADLFVLLDREFRRRKPRECNGCFVQLPYRVDTLNGDGANWEVIVPPRCAFGCDAVLDDIVNEFQQRYDLKIAA